MSRDYAKVASPASIQKAVDALQANGFQAESVKTLEDAKQRVLSLIPEGAEVFTGTSVTLTTAGLDAELNESGKYVSVRHKFMPLYGQKDKAVEMRRIGSGSEYTVGSVHAITEDGQVLVASASGSQLPNYVYGADHVIWVVGAQKVVKDLNEAMDRLETYTFPLENERAREAYGADSIISKLLIYKKERNPERVHIVIFNEAVGF